MAKTTTEEDRQKEFIKSSDLVGRKIVEVRYLNDEETNTMGWFKKTPILILDDGRQVIPQQDDEGNDGGMLVVYNPKDGKEVGLPNF